MGAPKALLGLDGETFVDRLAGTFAACCHDVIVVLGCAAEQIQAGMKKRELCRVVVNPRPELGQLSSLQCGLRALRESDGGILMIPVDCPGVRVSTVARLQDALGGTFVVPLHGGLRGHPVGFRATLAAEFFELDPATETARSVVHRHRDTTVYVEVDDPAILWDIDDHEQYLRTVQDRPA